MYLKDLMQGEKYAFYSMVNHLVMVDGEYSQEEQKMMDEFLMEMQLDKESIPDISMQDAVDMLTYSSPSTRRKIYIELVGVTLCDEFLHEDEKVFLDKVADEFSISEDVRTSLNNIVHDLLEIYKDMERLIDLPEEQQNLY